MEVLTQPELITDAIDWWLIQECDESATGHNSVLDDYEQARADYQRSLTDSANQNFRKAESHYSRYRKFLMDMQTHNIADDRFMARMIHHSLMFTSGGFRTECFLRAEGQEEYEDLRFKGEHARGVDVGRMVLLTLDDAAGKGPQASFAALDWLARETRGANNAVHNRHQEITEWMNFHPNLAYRAFDTDDLVVQWSRDIQRAGISAAVSCIAVAAAFREDDLARVPFLEPKSITTASTNPIYPLVAEGAPWAS